jgi:aerobic carbon-monoxide dehydrogenase small subunit
MSNHPAFVETMTVRLKVNGREVVREVSVRRLLADFIREDLRLTATHLGCDHGACGACTVILNGASVRSCLTLAVQADGGEVTTLEGFGSDGDLDPLRQAFREHHAIQCGFCTSGMLITARELLDSTRGPISPEHVRHALSGNLCRCTGYANIIDAVVSVAARRD